MHLPKMADVKEKVVDTIFPYFPTTLLSTQANEKCPVDFHLDVWKSSRANCIGVDHAPFANRIADLVLTGEIERGERGKKKKKR